MRKFKSGATRDDDFNKIDYEGFLSPIVLKAYGEYMNKHRIQPDGKIKAFYIGNFLVIPRNKNT